MNQDPNNPIASNPATPQMPTDLGGTMSNPAAAATPTLDAAPAPSAIPEVPTIDASLLQEAIADVPEEAAATTPNVPSAVSLDNIAATDPMAPAASPETSPFSGAAPAANFSAPEETPATPADPNATPANDSEAQKTTPSVAFNDPAQQPDAGKGGKKVDLSGVVEKIKSRPMLAIFGIGTIVIVALILILAFAI
ncbi:hypothetical protein IK146_03220 [Candidatus Saccharibacteria bacterium]|nr:hypothetical protein [Candidatus Saccharibacteria bacterium]